MNPLHGRRALVTGGGRGIGRAIALALARAGADVAVAARSKDEIESVAAEIRAIGGCGVAVQMDLMQRDRIEERVKTAAAMLGGLEIVVNNAGGNLAHRHEFHPERYDPRAFEDNLFFNLTQVFLVTRAALAFMIEKQWGRVLNIGSGAAHRSSPLLAYSTAKHGLAGYTRSLACATARFGINVNMLNPGWTETSNLDWDQMARSMRISVEDARRSAAAEGVQRRIIAPEELGPMAVLLCSDAGSAITGQMIGVDGGYKL
jgi:meso-butanediol dehydrogenase/(S,S)-butanediol dehydrogenase/diacetyl reductase